MLSLYYILGWSILSYVFKLVYMGYVGWSIGEMVHSFKIIFLFGICNKS